MNQAQFCLNPLRLARWSGIGLLTAVTLGAGPAFALPSFSVQTGEDCTSCHVGGFGPQLTQHGRIFKLQGYGATQSWQRWSKAPEAPLAAMAVANYIRTAKDQTDPPADHTNRNDNVSLQEAAIFLAGRISDSVGAFAQATYSGIDRKMSLDNVDVRFAREVKFGERDAVIGASVNNNPTVQDVWNSTPAWGYPYTSADLALSPSAAPLIAGGLEQQVIGGSGYVWFDDHIYAELGGYRSLSDNFLHNVNIDKGVYVRGTAPYWRLAYSSAGHGRNYSVGLFGLDAKLKPDPAVSGTDHYSDIGIDGTYQMNLPHKAVLSLNGAYIRERQTLDASYDAEAVSERKGRLNSFTTDASYYWDKKYGFTLGLFRTSGSSDTSLYAPEADFGSRVGKPDSSGYRLQADWTPFGQEGSWHAPYANLRMGVQYTGYQKFNGASHDYDGFGRDAKDNNAVSLFLWTAF